MVDILDYIALTFLAIVILFMFAVWVFQGLFLAFSRESRTLVRKRFAIYSFAIFSSPYIVSMYIVEIIFHRIWLILQILFKFLLHILVILFWPLILLVYLVIKLINWMRMLGERMFTMTIHFYGLGNSK